MSWIKKDCRGRRPKRPRERPRCPRPSPTTPKPPPPATAKPKPPPKRAQPGHGQCWTCKFWTPPVPKMPNYGVCELTTLVNLRRHRYVRALAKVQVIEGVVQSLESAPSEISTVTVRQFGCVSWEKE